jgi:hypothetical protein
MFYLSNQAALLYKDIPVISGYNRHCTDKLCHRCVLYLYGGFEQRFILLYTDNQMRQKDECKSKVSYK